MNQFFLLISALIEMPISQTFIYTKIIGGSKTLNEYSACFAENHLPSLNIYYFDIQLLWCPSAERIN